MNLLFPRSHRGRKTFSVVTAFVLTAVLQVTSALARPDSAEIECTTPDGRLVEVVTADNQTRCALPEGETTFVIKLPGATMLDRFTFVNENATAAGKLKIYVSDSQLSATSDKWVAVDGEIPFSKKRLFNLSMLGVDARYVKLAFKVDRPVRIAGF